MGEADAAEGEDHLGRQFFVALEAAARDRVAHRLLDFALRGDADLLEKSTQAGIENVFVHVRLLIAPRSYTDKGVARTPILRGSQVLAPPATTAKPLRRDGGCYGW